MKYFVFNKWMDYTRGYIEHCCWKEDTLVLSEGYLEGGVISRVLDSRENGTVWHRFTQGCDNSYGASANIFVYAGDKRNIIWEEKECSIDDIILSQSISFQKKIEILAPYLQMEMNNPTDKLLFDVKGRYLWFVIKIKAGQEIMPQIKDVTFYFPKETWLKYLPEIYQKNRESREFLEQYLGIFQSIYEDMERYIREDASLLDADATTDEFLTWLASWLDIGHLYMWSRDKLRRLIAHFAELYELRGTKRGLLDVLALYTGGQVLLVEEWQTRKYRELGNQKEELERLYGKDPNVCTLLLKEEHLSSSQNYQVILSLVKSYAPAYIEVRIVPIKPFLFLGKYTYLGINSGLGQYRSFKLDGNSVLHYTAIGKGKPEGEQS